VRDFRDMICSMLAFDAKRQARAFQGDDVDVEAFIFRIVDDVRRLAEAWHERRGTALLLRYEDLVTEPHASLRRVADDAGSDASPAVIERMVETSRRDEDRTRAHRTTDDGPRSIGRYRYDMNEDMRDLCLEIGADLLAGLGYVADGVGRSHAESNAASRV